jgi:hypothetical protein
MRFSALATLAAFSLTATGCAIHKDMPRPMSPAAVTEVREALESRGAWLEYGYPGYLPLIGAVQRGSFQPVDLGRPSLIFYTDDPAHAVPLEHARSLQVNNHWLGALEGLGIGALSGLLLGALLMAAAGEGSGCENPDAMCIDFNPGQALFILSLTIGPIAGTTIGAAVGQRTVYDF